MTQEEKAKAYDEALEKGRIFRDHLLETGDKGIAEEIEYIFPALSQSEDERIRKALVRFHKSTIDIDGIKGADILAWLEKQGEQKQEWSEEDENMAEDLIKGCVSAEKAHHFLHTPKEVSEWLKSIKDRMKGKED